MTDHHRFPMRREDRSPIDHEPIRIAEPPMFRWFELVGLFALAFAGMVALWFGAR